MANLSNWISKITQETAPTTNAELNTLKSNYSTSLANLNNSYGNSMSQAKQTLSQVPAQFNGQRTSADITKNQAMDLLPSELSNSGASTDSGANYVASTNIGNGFQNNMSAIGTAQNAAKQAAQNNINSLGVAHQSDVGNLANTYNGNLASALSTNTKNVLDTALSQYNNQQSLEQSEAANAASLAAQKQEAADNLAYKYAALHNKQLTAKAKSNTISNSDYNKYFKTAQTFFNSGSGGLPEKDAQGNYPSTQWSPQQAMKYLQGLKIPNNVKDKIASQIVRTFPEYSEIDRNGNAFTVPARTYTLADYIKWFSKNQTQQNKNLYGK